MRRGAIPAVLLAAVALATVAAREPPDGTSSDARERGVVTRVFDGDTLEVKLAGGPRRVRLIGIDTPEIRDNDKLARDVRRTGRSREALIGLGRTATAFTRDVALRREVGLEFDAERRDRYGRLLAYVWLPDGRLLNAELLREGHALLMTIPPNVRHVDLLRRLQSEAREAGRGLWGRSPSSRGGTPRRGAGSGFRGSCPRETPTPPVHADTGRLR